MRFNGRQGGKTADGFSELFEMVDKAATPSKRVMLTDAALARFLALSGKAAPLMDSRAADPLDLAYIRGNLGADYKPDPGNAAPVFVVSPDLADEARTLPGVGDPFGVRVIVSAALPSRTVRQVAHAEPAGDGWIAIDMGKT